VLTRGGERGVVCFNQFNDFGKQMQINRILYKHNHVNNSMWQYYSNKQDSHVKKTIHNVSIVNEDDINNQMW
jgi:hypothetical protein